MEKHSSLILKTMNLLEKPIDKSITKIIAIEEFDNFLLENQIFKKEYLNLINKKINEAFFLKIDRSSYEIHSVLYQLYNLQNCDPLSIEATNQHSPFLYQIKNKIESQWFESLKKEFTMDLTTNSNDISLIINELCSDKKLSEHKIFEFIAKNANIKQLFAFFMSDYELNIHFFNLLLLTLLNSPINVRAEIVKNIWDEAGNGNPKETHVNMFNDLIKNYNIDNKNNIKPHNTWQKLAGYNLFMLASTNRKYYYILLGIMAATEIIDPLSYIKVKEGCLRNKIDEWLFRYYIEHSEIDIEHAKGWLVNVIEPIINNSLPQSQQEIKKNILLGVNFRLKTCTDYYNSLFDYLITIE